MLLKRLFSIAFLLTMLLATTAYAGNVVVIYESSSYNNSRPCHYDYAYRNPPRQSLGAYGRYIFSSSKVRYVHSPSRLKGAHHAARIDYNNRIYDNI